jgi:hypothetical protein
MFLRNNIAWRKDMLNFGQRQQIEERKRRAFMLRALAQEIRERATRRPLARLEWRQVDSPEMRKEALERWERTNGNSNHVGMATDGFDAGDAGDHRPELQNGSGLLASEG